MRALRHTVLGFVAGAWLVPLYFVVVNATVLREEYGDRPLWSWPATFGLDDNMAAAWRLADLGASVASTLLYAVVGAAVAVLLAALAAFAIVALRVPHGFTWFMFLYAGTVFPLQMFIAPLYSMYVQLNLYDTRTGLLLLYTAVAIPFAVFILRNHFTTVPADLHEAAQLDGASALRSFWHVYLPMSVNALAAVFVFQFTWIWNDLLFGLTLSRSASVRPVMTALATLQGEHFSASVPVVLAGALLAALPTMVLFFMVQRVFVRGLAVAGRY